MISFVSTRSDPAEPASKATAGPQFAELLFATTTEQGGLYMPSSLPDFSNELSSLALLSYQDLVVKLIAPFVGDSISLSSLQELVRKAYARFHHPEIVTLKQYPQYALLELYHGPTYAFKDLALQLLGELFDHFLKKSGEKRLFLGSTSGDTGSAAIYALKGRETMKLVMLHPHDRVSKVQAQQMLSVADANILNLAIQGDFDDAQNIVKSLFQDAAFAASYKLSAVNSINLVRILLQVPYYFYAYFRAKPEQQADLILSVPSGNFGNFFAAYLAKLIGLPIKKLVVASNHNNILTRFFQTGEYRPSKVKPSLSPSMDIQVASNLERFLWLLFDKDGAKLRELFSNLQKDGYFKIDPAIFKKSVLPIEVGFASDFSTKQRIKEHYSDYQDFIDPHTAVGIEVALTRGVKSPIIAATAHPAKFYDLIEQLVGLPFPLPQDLEKLFDLPARSVLLPASAAAVREIVEHQTI